MAEVTNEDGGIIPAGMTKETSGVQRRTISPCDLSLKTIWEVSYPSLCSEFRTMTSGK